MQYCITDVLFNSVINLPADYFHGFRIYSYISQGLPYGYIDIIDRSAEYFAKFGNLQIGATVDITLTNIENEKDTRKFPQYYILKVENEFILDVSKFAGIIRVWFGHPWFIFKDVKNHAYAPEKAGELIKKILRDKHRGIDFSYKKGSKEAGEIKTAISALGQDDDNGDFDFEKTDDPGKFARYKIAETDWDFIHDKILPYTSISSLPVCFYCDEKYGMFHLKNFKSLFKQKPKILFHQREDALAEGKNYDKIEGICDKHNIPKQGGHFAVQAANVSIGEFDYLREIFPSFATESLQDSTFLSGSKKLGNMIRPRTGPSFGNLLPIDFSLMGKITGTSTKLIHNRQLVDGLLLLFQNSKHLDEMFKLNLTTTFNGDLMGVGCTAEIYITPLLVDEDEWKSHWLGGKWLCTGIEHYSSENDKRLIMSDTLLSRPAFVGSDDFTSLYLAEAMYES